MNGPCWNVTLSHAGNHPVLPEASSWHLHGLRMDVPAEGDAEGVRVELLLRRHGQTRRLRCAGVTDFSMRFAVVGIALRILDVSHLQWSGITVRVESACGALGFWAATVVAEHGDRVDAATSAERTRDAASASGEETHGHDPGRSGQSWGQSRST